MIFAFDHDIYIYIYIYIYICVCVCVCVCESYTFGRQAYPYLPTPPLGQDMTQGQLFLSEV